MIMCCGINSLNLPAKADREAGAFQGAMRGLRCAGDLIAARTAR